MEWVVPAVNGVVPAARHSHRAVTVNADTMLMFAGSGQEQALDDLFHFKISCVSGFFFSRSLCRFRCYCMAV